MMHKVPEPTALQTLRRETRQVALASGLFLLAFGGLLWAQLGLGGALRWLVLAAGLAAYLYISLWPRLVENHRPLGAGPAELLPDLGPANRISIARAVLTAALFGFLALPRPDGWLAWAPGVLYLLVALMDFVDGWVARRTQRSTVLGDRLDMQWDGAGVGIAALLLVLYGQAPVPYLLVGLARYLFVLGGWLRRRQGLPVYDLPPSRSRRALAGAQMGFIAAILLPVFTPPATQVAALLFMLPLLAGFLRDWLAVSGQLRLQAPGRAPSRLGRGLRLVYPLALRGLMLALLAGILLEQFRLGAPAPGILLVGLISLPALALGAAGRIAAVAVMLMAGFALQAAPLDGRYWLLLLLSTGVFLIGTGRLSLWKPEDWLIDHRAGE